MALDRIDRIQLAVTDRSGVAERWQALLDAPVLREDRVAALGCRRSVLGVGTSEVELLEADSDGPVREAGPGLFAAGVSTPDFEALRNRISTSDVPYAEEDGQIFIAPEALGTESLRVVVSASAARTRYGLLERLYEVTHLVTDAARTCARFAEVFDVEPSNFVAIRSAEFGYEGSLTLFRPGELDRVEVITPFDRQKTMGRYFDRHGASLYMSYGESDRTDEIRARALAHAPADWTGPKRGATPDNLFLHPRALGGVMLGVSRTSYAWTWSGAPERVSVPS